MQISLAIPPKLKQQLVAEHDAIKKEAKLLPLPRAPCVEEILAAYSTAHSKKGVPDSDAEQVANGLRVYFDRCLALVRFSSVTCLPGSPVRCASPQCAEKLSDSGVPARL